MPKAKARNYNIPDADLIQRADAIGTCLTRDAADFLTRGITAAQTGSAIADARAEFDDFPTDEELSGLVTTAAGVKDAARRALEVAVRPIRNMAELEYKSTGLYNTFGFDGFAELPDNDLLRAAKRINRVAGTLQPDLADRGLTQPQLDNLKTLYLAFDDALDAVDKAVAERDIQTQKRIRLGNALYTQLAEVASVGRSLYEDTDEAKYNDYVIEQTIGGGSGGAGGPA